MRAVSKVMDLTVGLIKSLIIFPFFTYDFFSHIVYNKHTYYLSYTCSFLTLLYTHEHTLSLFLFHTHTNTPSDSLSNTHILTHTFVNAHTPSTFYTLMHTHTYSLSLCLSLSLSLSLSHTHTQDFRTR